MDQDTHQDAQHDPKNTRPASARRIRWSFVVIVLIFLALSLTAMMIWTHQTP
jgi:4-hydroxybenzoate polyprenyltransferase